MIAIVRAASVRWKDGKTRRAASGHRSGRKPGEPAAHRASPANAHTRIATLLATAHAHSFSLALQHELYLGRLSLGEMIITAAVTITPAPARSTTTQFHLTVVSRLPAITQSRFIDATVRAKKNCLVSRSLSANVSMNATLEAP